MTKPNAAEHPPRLSLLIVARDAAAHLPATLAMVAAQDLGREHFEVIVVIDPASRDASEAIARDFVTETDVDIRVELGQQSGLAPGWNLGIEWARGRYILRWDAHGRYPPGFLRASLAAIESSHSDIVGGACLPALDPNARTNPRPEAPHPRLLAWAEASPFVSISSFRSRGPKRTVASLARAVYRRRVFELVGGFRNFEHGCEDVEAHARMRRAGFSFEFQPDIESFHYLRSNLAGLDRQKFRNGSATTALWLAFPGCFRPGHLLPVAWLVCPALGSLLAICGYGPGWWPPLYLALSFVALVLGLGLWIRSDRAAQHRCDLGPRPRGFEVAICAALVLRIHLVFGLGSLHGLRLVGRSRRAPLPRPRPGGRS